MFSMSIKHTLVFILVCICFNNILGQEKGPEISFETKQIDYGIIKNNSNGQRTFSFINTGDENLIIIDVRSSCGCTIPKKPDEPILPGEKSKIIVQYDTKNRQGSFKKTITVTTNIEENPIVELRIIGTVLPRN